MVGKVVYKGIVRFNLNLLILLIHGVCGKLLYAKFSARLCSFIIVTLQNVLPSKGIQSLWIGVVCVKLVAN